MRTQASSVEADVSVTLGEPGQVLEMIRPLAAASTTESGAVLIRITPGSQPQAANSQSSQTIQTAAATQTDPATKLQGSKSGAATTSSEAAATLNARAGDGSLRGDPAVAITASSIAAAATGEQLSIIIGFN